MRGQIDRVNAVPRRHVEVEQLQLEVNQASASNNRHTI